MDLFMAGTTKDLDRIGRLYQNDGAGIFTLVDGMPFEGCQYCSMAFSDIDGDLDNDLLMVGYTPFGHIAKVYIKIREGSYCSLFPSRNSIPQTDAEISINMP